MDISCPISHRDVDSSVPAASIIEIRPRQRGLSRLRRLPGVIKRAFSRPWRVFQFREFGKKSSIDRPSLLVGCHRIRVGAGVSVWHSARIEAIDAAGDGELITIGDGTLIQPYVHIGAVLEVVIGSGCLFATSVYITDHDHDYSNPAEALVSNRRLLASPVNIGDRVWLGERVMVLKGVQIGEGSIVGAGSIVTRSIPPLSIAVGSPAKVIKRWDPTLRRWVQA